MGEKLITQWETTYPGFTANRALADPEMTQCTVEWSRTESASLRLSWQRAPYDGIYVTTPTDTRLETTNERVVRYSRQVGRIKFAISGAALFMLARTTLDEVRFQDFVYLPDRGFIRVIRRLVELVNRRESWPYIFPNQPLKEQIVRVCLKCGTVDEDPTTEPLVTVCFASPGNCEWLDLCRKHPHGLYDSIL